MRTRTHTQDLRRSLRLLHHVPDKRPAVAKTTTNRRCGDGLLRFWTVVVAVLDDAGDQERRPRHHSR